MLTPVKPNDSTVKQSPWLVGEQRFTRISDHDQISDLIKEARDNNHFVTITVPAKPNIIFYDSFILDIVRDKLRLYRSSKWPTESPGENFRVYFRNSLGYWHTFQTTLMSEDTHSISVSMPTKMFVLKHRDHNRLELPPNTKAKFKFESKSAGNFQVVNISKTGMLIRSCDKNITLPIFSHLNDIVIDLPASDNLPPIEQGQVVRCFKTDKGNTLCYGVLFKEDCNADEEIIWSIISQDANC